MRSIEAKYSEPLSDAERDLQVALATIKMMKVDFERRTEDHIAIALRRMSLPATDLQVVEMLAQELRGIAKLLASEDDMARVWELAEKLNAQADKLDEESKGDYPDGMFFEAALYAIRRGNRVARASWEGRWVALHRIAILSGDEKMTENFLYSGHVTGWMVPWTPAQTDLLAQDWKAEQNKALLLDSLLHEGETIQREVCPRDARGRRQ